LRFKALRDLGFADLFAARFRAAFVAGAFFAVARLPDARLPATGLLTGLGDRVSGIIGLILVVPAQAGTHNHRIRYKAGRFNA
jgi:hypothetical protein